MLALAGVLLAARLALPHVLESVVNDRLQHLGEYRGHVEDVDVALLAGAYSIDDISIVKVGAGIEQPFAEIESLELSLQWRALFRGRVVGETVLVKPVVHFVQGADDQQSQLGRGVNWPQEVRDLFPFQLNQVEARDGLATFRAPGISSGESLTLRALDVDIRNLKNVQGREQAAFAQVELAGEIMGQAPLTAVGSIDPNEQYPTFDLDITLEGVDLPRVNPWLREYLKVDAESGRFALYSELATADGQFEGYVKPILENPRIFRFGEDSKTPFHALWEALVQVVAAIFENPPEEQVATQIPLSGTLENPDSDVLAAFVGLARNAFVAALSHSINDSVSLRRVRDGEPDEGDNNN